MVGVFLHVNDGGVLGIVFFEVVEEAVESVVDSGVMLRGLGTLGCFVVCIYGDLDLLSRV